MLRRAINGAAKKFGIKILLGKVRDAAEGKMGPGWKRAYWALAGVKTYTGLVLAAAAAVLDALGYREAAIAIGSFAVVAVQAGVIDKAWRSEIPAALAQSGLYRFLARYSAELTALVGVVFVWIQRQACGDPCDLWAKVVLGAAVVLVHLGLVDVAWMTRGPDVYRRLFPDEDPQDPPAPPRGR